MSSELYAVQDLVYDKTAIDLQQLVNEFTAKQTPTLALDNIFSNSSSSSGTFLRNGISDTWSISFDGDVSFAMGAPITLLQKTYSDETLYYDITVQPQSAASYINCSVVITDPNLQLQIENGCVSDFSIRCDDSKCLNGDELSLDLFDERI